MSMRVNGNALNGSRNLDLGSMHAASFRDDAKHVGFVLRRYHFVARMLQGAGRVLEVGCGDGTGAPIVRAAVKEWIGIDRDEDCSGYVWDILYGPYEAAHDLDGVYAIDVLEHIPPDREDWALVNMRSHLKPHGKLIIGMPSRESQMHASSLSRLHHVNTKSEDELVETMGRHFHTVYILGLNDYTLHDGFGPMCHYRFALCSGKR
jgi:SAM-dependent methyltransferase